MQALDCEEAKRWLRQAGHTLSAVHADLESEFYDWACFKANQAAEFALKALLRGAGLESFGHNLLELWRRASRICPGLEDLRDCIALLNKLYIPPRYPDAWAAGTAPYENFTRRDALEALNCAKQVLEAIRRCISDACKDS